MQGRPGVVGKEELGDLGDENPHKSTSLVKLSLSRRVLVNLVAMRTMHGDLTWFYRRY